VAFSRYHKILIEEKDDTELPELHLDSFLSASHLQFKYFSKGSSTTSASSGHFSFSQPFVMQEKADLK
jgi:hypothetical protein